MFIQGRERGRRQEEREAEDSCPLTVLSDIGYGGKGPVRILISGQSGESGVWRIYPGEVYFEEYS